MCPAQKEKIFAQILILCKNSLVKFIYSEKATKFCEIFTLLLTTVHTVKSKVKLSQNFVAFSEYMNFTNLFTQCTYFFLVCNCNFDQSERASTCKKLFDYSKKQYFFQNRNNLEFTVSALFRLTF